MSTIDQRIVDMRFNNQQFERGIGESVSSLERLRRGLDLEGATRSLTNLDRAGRNFSLSGMAEGIDAIRDRFTPLGIMGMTVLQNLTMAALDAGKRIVSALTIDPMKTGFEEYEIKMNAIKTILSNTKGKGTTLDDVNKALADLNEYADKTVYNFAQMTDMVGKFATKSGELESSVNMVKGLANLAAEAGVDNTNLQRALYQTSMIAETVQSLDWMSIDNAGLGTVKFKDDLIAMAKAMGTIDQKTLKDLDSGVVNFRSTLQEGWLTKGVFNAVTTAYALDEAMTKAAGEVNTFTKLITVMKETVQSGWAVTWEKIIGTKDESLAFFTAISNAFGDVARGSADARNGLLEFWRGAGGRNALIEGISNVLVGLASVIEPIEQAFRSIFPPMTGQILVDLTNKFKTFTESFKIGEETANNLKNTFKGVFALLNIGKQVIFALGKALLMIIRTILPAGNGLLYFTGSIGEFIAYINDAIQSSDLFGKGLRVLEAILKPFGYAIKTAIGFIVAGFKSLGALDLTFVVEQFNRILKSFSDLKETIINILDTFMVRIINRFKSFKIIADLVSDTMSKFRGSVNKDTQPPAWLDKVGKALKKFVDIIERAFVAISTGLEKSFSEGNFSPLFDLINAGLLGTIVVGITKFISSLSGIVGRVGGFIGQFASITGNVNGILKEVRNTLSTYQSTIKANVLKTIAISIAILAASLIALSLVDSKRLAGALAAITGAFVNLFGSMYLFLKFTSAGGLAQLGKLSLSFIGFSTAILILSFAMKKLGDQDWAGVAKGIISIAALFGLLIGASKLLEKYTVDLIKISANFVIFGIAIRVLAGAVKQLGDIDTPNLIRGLIGFGVVLTELALFMKVMNSVTMSLKGQVAIATLAISMNILAFAVKQFSDPEIAMGLVGMAGALLIVAGAIKLMPSNMFVIGTELLAMSASIFLLGYSLEKLSGLSWEGIAKALVTLAGALAIMAGAMYLMSGASVGIIPLLAMAGAIVILTPALAALSLLPLSGIGKALLVLAGTFTIMGIAGYLLGPVIPIILGLSAAIVLLGIAVMAVGVGVSLFAAGIAVLATVTTAGVAGITAVLLGIAKILPQVMRSIGEGIVELIKSISESSSDIIDAFTNMLIGLLTSIANNISKFIDAGVNIIMGFLKGIADNTEKVISVVSDIIKAILDGLTKKTPEIIQSGINFIITFINGMANGIRNNSDDAIKAVDNLFDAIKGALIKSVTKFMPDIGKDIVLGLVGGITNNTPSVEKASSSLGGVILSAIKKKLDINSPSEETAKLGENAGEGLTKGLESSEGPLSKMAKGIAKNLLDSLDISKGVEDNGKKVEKSVEKTSNKSSKSSEEAAKKASEAAKKAFDASVEWIDERKYYNKLSLSEELEAWQKIQKQYIEGSEYRKKADREVFRVRRELLKAEYEASVSWIDDRKYYNQLSLIEELASWERVQKRYIEGSEERKKADKEVYRLKKELGKEQFQNSLNWIENEKFYDRSNLTKELSDFKRVQARYADVNENSSADRIEEKKKADKEVYRLEKEIKDTNKQYTKEVLTLQKESNEVRKDLEDDYYAKTKEVNAKLKQDVDSVTDEYKKAVKSRADSLYNAYGLFDKVGTKEEEANRIAKKKELEKELADWQRTQAKYLEGTEKRRQADKEVARVQKELLTVQPLKGTDLIANLEDQVEAFNFWKDSLKVLSVRGIDKGLLSELEALGPKSTAEIKALNQLSKPELDKYVALWRQKHADATTQATGELEGMRIESVAKIKKLQTDAGVELDKYRKVWADQMLTLQKNTNAELETIKTEWLAKIGTIRTKTEWEFIRLINSVTTKINRSNWSKLGENIVGGIITGIKSKEMMLSDTMANLAQKSMLEPTNKALDIKSPSKEFAKVGRFSIEGLVDGLKKYSYLVVNASSDVGNVAKTTLKDTFSNLTNILSGNFDMSPTITPVLDMANVESGLSSAFGQPRAIDLTASTIKASSISASGQNGTSGVTNQTDNTKNTEIVINNTYTVRSNEDIRKISVDLKNTLDRYHYAKGVTV